MHQIQPCLPLSITHTLDQPLSSLTRVTSTRAPEISLLHRRQKYSFRNLSDLFIPLLETVLGLYITCTMKPQIVFMTYKVLFVLAPNP